MPITEQQVLDALRHVEEPDLKQDLVTLGMVRDVRVSGLQVSFTVVLTTPACPLKELIHNACVTAIKHLVSRDAEVTITMTANVTTGTAAQGTGLPGIRNIIAVASGKGGVGKSTVAVNLAIALAQRGARVGLLDADIYGPSVPLMMGLVDAQPEVSEIDGRQRMHPLERHGIKVMSIGFLVDSNQSIVWRGPMVSNAFKQLVNDTLWGELDYLVCDLPPGTGDIHITLSQQFPLTGAVIVTTPQPVAVADARKAVGMFLSPAIRVPVLGVVENMAWFTPPELPDRRYFLFGQGGAQAIADEFSIPVLGQLPIVEDLRAGGDAGLPSALDAASPVGSAFAALAGAVAQQVSILNARAQPQSAQPVGTKSA
jgi:ATP-binding protein involved in chromosome partitioning